MFVANPDDTINVTCQDLLTGASSAQFLDELRHLEATQWQWQDTRFECADGPYTYEAWICDMVLAIRMWSAEAHIYLAESEYWASKHAELKALV